MPTYLGFGAFLLVPRCRDRYVDRSRTVGVHRERDPERGRIARIGETHWWISECRLSFVIRLVDLVLRSDGPGCSWVQDTTDVGAERGVFEHLVLGARSDEINAQ